MRLGTIQIDGVVRTVAQEGPNAPVHDLTDLTHGDLRRAFGADLHRALDSAPVITNMDRARWLPPISDPAKILCVGLNYRTHAAEVLRDVEEHPTLFTRFASTFVGHGDQLLIPPESDTLDWEGEIVAVIGRRGRRIPKAHALDHVAGYSVMGENSVRAYQLHTKQATAGKNWDRSGSWGPWVLLAATLTDPAVLEVVTRLNGEEKQRGRLNELVFDLASVIAYISTWTELAPGDLIATGTPAGIGYRETPPRYLRPGDELSIELVDHFTLVNTATSDPHARSST